MGNTVATAVISRRGAALGRKRTKPVPDEGTMQMSFRIDVELWKRIDAEVKRISALAGGVAVGHTDVVRQLIDEALTARAKSKKK